MLCQEGLCPQEGWHGLKMSDNVWRCRMCPNVSDKCLTWFAQPSTLILCRRHHWWSRTFCCPVASDICINSTGVDTSRETLRSQCQGESVTCDPKPARLVFWCLLTSYGVIAASTWMNNNAENKPFNQRITNVIYCNLCIFMIIYAWLCMYHAPSLVTYRVCPQSGLQWLSGRQKNPLQNPKQNPHGALRQCLSPVLVPVQLPQPKVPNASPANSKHLESNKFAENHRQFSGSTWLD